MSRWTSGGLTTARLETLADGIFAIAMTLLTLSIRIPDLSAAEVKAGYLPYRILELWPSLAVYGLSFAVLGVFWVGHHLVFHHIRRSDRVLLWLNIYYLAVISLLPVSTSLLGRYPNQQSVVILYALHLLVIGGLSEAQWIYATRNRRLVDREMTSERVRYAMWRIGVTPMVAVVSIALSFWNLQAAELVYIGALVFYLLPGRLDPQGEL